MLSCDVEELEWDSGSHSAFCRFLPASRESPAFFSLLLSLSPTSDFASSSPLIIFALSETRAVVEKFEGYIPTSGASGRRHYP
jgi:hypothetical protein